HQWLSEEEDPALGELFGERSSASAVDAHLHEVDLVPGKKPVCHPQSKSARVQMSGAEIVSGRGGTGQANRTYQLRDHSRIPAQPPKYHLHHKRRYRNGPNE